MTEYRIIYRHKKLGLLCFAHAVAQVMKETVNGNPPSLIEPEVTEVENPGKEEDVCNPDCLVCSPPAPKLPRAPETRKCEIFGCTTPGVRSHSIAPGTNLWLCDPCIEEMEKQAVR